MKTKIFPDYEQQSSYVADLMLKNLIDNPTITFCLASGGSPELAYQLFTEKVNIQNIDCSKLTMIALDEWVGVPPHDSGSCYYFLDKYIVKPLRLKYNQCHFFDALSVNFNNEIEKMDAAVTKNGIDIIIVGIGLNGHIGFNEPGVAPENGCHVIDLEDITKTVGQKYFDQPTKLSKGLTIGLKHFMEAKQAILMANGTKKAEIMSKTMNSPIDMKIPSTIIRKHKNAIIVIDQLAGSLINT